MNPVLLCVLYLTISLSLLNCSYITSSLDITQPHTTYTFRKFNSRIFAPDSNDFQMPHLNNFSILNQLQPTKSPTDSPTTPPTTSPTEVPSVSIAPTPFVPEVVELTKPHVGTATIVQQVYFEVTAGSEWVRIVDLKVVTYRTRGLQVYMKRGNAEGSEDVPCHWQLVAETRPGWWGK